ncbi:acetyl-CoA synthetase-like protein [Aspergillus heteromorphus CBS 117.55]|uniref:Acetyl-CoA synthetase-like protein n=1 Tax=Aspergillus heteromorphus CBS 117.55 TaxID=1448321 RepID=A0A317VZA7_9EURO|nr:acetyl-CoA synthetase-like protein [Aspergillus heteromorphus CBS 117.55]PWY79686.1 acetyl-CoA synthetase-like protein [Aspergillus heteromorphus CBS 117.55]
MSASSSPSLWNLLSNNPNNKPSPKTPTEIHIQPIPHLKTAQTRSTTPLSGISITDTDIDIDITALPSQSSVTSASTPNSLCPSPSLRPVRSCEDVSRAFEAVERASYAQERIWFLHEFLADATTFNVTLSYVVNGLLRADDLADAFRTVANRHESLRTAFFLDGQEAPQLHQGVLAESRIEISVREIDVAEVVDETYVEIKEHVYDLRKGRTMKVAILSLTPAVHFLILGFHHLVLDGFSAQIFIRDLQSVYAGGTLPPAPNYRAYAVAQRQSIHTEGFRQSLEFWKTKLANPPPPIPLFPFARVPTRKPLDRYQVHTVQRKLDIPLTMKIKEVAHKVGGTTSFFLYLTALRELIFRLSGQQEICIGMSDAGRSDKDSLQMVGMFVNMIPLVFKTARPGQSFRNLLATTTKQVRTALGHSAVPYQTLLDELAVKKSPYESPLFQILLNYKMGSTESAMLGESRAENLRMDDARTGLDLVVEVEEFVDGNCLLAVKGQEYLYSEASLEFILSSLVVVLQSVASNPNIPVTNIGVFEEGSVARALAVGCGERVSSDLDDQMTVVHLFEKDCLDQPEKVAVRADGQSLTYGELRGRALQLAAHLHGLGPSGPVVVVCKPSLDSIVAILGIHYAGCIYVPVDTEHPEERLRTIVQDCDARAVVHHDATCKLAAAVAGNRTLVNTSQLVPAAEFPIQASPSGTAYILYTSGSTGKPKGVVVRHRNLTCQIQSMQRDIGLSSETVLLQSGLGFDASIDCIYAALAGQGTLVVVSPEVRRDPEQLAALMTVEGITYTQMTSSEYHNLLIYGDLSGCKTWRNAFCGGEKFLPGLCPLFEGLNIPSLRVWNRYGPTEITVSSSLHLVTGRGADPDVPEVIPCGRPLSNYSVHILDDQRRPVPAGVPGEICIGGGGVAQGYLNNARLTASKFVKNAYASEADVRRGWDKLYRTGDRGYLQHDGAMVFLGRMEGSTQVKIRGNRVELDEIETAIVAASGGKVLAAGVCVKGDNADATLAAYLVMPVADASFIKELAKSLPLPRYMRPSSFISVRKLPQTTSGKLDRAALASLLGTAIQIDTSTAPLSEQEQAMAHAWRQVLGEVTLSADANFFEVGGNSLLLVRLQKILSAGGTSIPLTELFSAPLLSAMAGLLAQTQTPTESASPPSIDWDAETRIPPSFTSLPLPTPPSKPKKETLTVLLTGSTGFLGRSILHALLTSPKIQHIHCLAVRNPSSPHLTTLLPPSALPKITIHPGDLTHPTLSLPPSTIATLRQTADLILHNAATVSFIAPYPTLRAPNHLSTQFLTSLALPRRIPIHFISTGGVVALTNQPSWRPVSVRAHPPPPDGKAGYIASKWASEVFLERVAERYSLPVWVHRPASITGEGVPELDIMGNVVGWTRRLRCFPDRGEVNWLFDFVDVGDVAGGVVGRALGGRMKWGRRMGWE